MATLATEKQIRALQIAYKKGLKDGDPRTALNSDQQLTNDDARAMWTAQKIGHLVLDPEGDRTPSWKGLTMAEAGYLLDYLFHKETRLDAALRAEFARLEVKDEEAYFEGFCRPRDRFSKTVWTYGGRAYSRLTFIDKCKLLSTLKTRTPARRA